MSTPTKIAFARPVNDMAREVRVIHALFPQECLDQLSPDSTTYHNTGVQTLPPANGDVYKLINGREPSQTDYTRNMGIAAIGRYQQDPRSNPCELIYGAAYTAPHATATYTSSGFQTADYNTSRRALARAKVQASVTANKYRGAAAQAGYVVCAESKDEYIVHSEQYPTTARLDKGGNLLEGSIQTRHLPNIHHSSVKMDACQSPRYPSEPFERMSALDEYGDVRSSADEFVTATSPGKRKLDEGSRAATKRHRRTTLETPQKSYYANPTQDPAKSTDQVDPTGLELEVARAKSPTSNLVNPPRTQRTPRQAFTPYVPPAMRDRARRV